MKTTVKYISLALLPTVLIASAAFGQGAPAPSSNPLNGFTNPLELGLVIVAVLLLIVIAVLASLLKGLGRQNTNIHIKNNEGKPVEKPRQIRTTWVRGSTVIALLLSATGAFAQDATSVYPKAPQLDWFIIVMLLFITLEFVMILTLISTIKRMFKANGIISDVVLQQVAVEAKAAKVHKPSFMQKFLTKAVPLEQEEAITFDHEYDGIRELDNSLPPWWLYGFYISIVFAFVYMFHFHVVDTGNLQAAEYQQELADADAKKNELLKKMAAKGEVMVNEDNVTYLTDAAALAAGKATFDGLCSSCHGTNAQGGIGPNLTDEYWLYGGSIKNIFKTVTNGTPNGMQSWKSQLSPKNIQDVSSYVKSLLGSKPAGAKEPQGDLYKEETTVPDTTAAKQDTVAIKTVGAK